MTLPLELGGIHDPSIRRALEQLAQQFPIVVTGGGGGAPSGPASGDLGGSYPGPTVVKAQSGFTVGGVLAVLTSDSRLSDSRTPTAHHATHEPGGTDAMAVDAAAATGSLRTIGTGALQACAGNDSRLSNARAPTAHATTHQPGGSDAMAVDAAAATGSLRTIGTGALQAAAGNDSRLSDARTPTAHHTTHEPGGTDAMAVDAAAATGSLRTIGTGALQATAGNDSRLSNARTPTAHATTHQPGGSDPMAVDAAAATGSLRTLGTTSTSAASGDRGLPTGGTSGQVLAKNSATNYDVGWAAAGGSPATVLTQYKTLWDAAVQVPTQGVAATFLASRFGAVAALAAAGTAAFAFVLDPADLAFTGTTNKIRLRSTVITNAVAPGGTWTVEIRPVATFGGASATLPTIATVSAATVSNSHVTPGATTSVTTNSSDVNFPTAGKYTFSFTTSAAMASNSQVVILYELQARQV